MWVNPIIRAVVDVIMAFLFLYSGLKLLRLKKTFLNTVMAICDLAFFFFFLNIPILFVSSNYLQIDRPYGMDLGLSYSLGDYVVFPFAVLKLLVMTGSLLRFGIWLQRLHDDEK